MLSLGMEGGAAHRNWATPVAPLAGEGVGKDEGLTNCDLWPRMGGGVLTVKIRQPSHEFTFGVGMSFIPYPLVLTPVV
jgi:hypothetical protein